MLDMFFVINHEIVIELLFKIDIQINIIVQSIRYCQPNDLIVFIIKHSDQI